MSCEYGTPLTEAIECDKIENVRLLIEKGADLNKTDPNGWTPVTNAIYKNNLNILQLLIERGADVNFVDSFNWTPLIKAISTNKIEAVKVLIANGANVNLGAVISPLSAAVYKNYFKIVKLLVENGALINLHNSIGKTPFHSAILHKNMSIITYFLENGANLISRTKHNNENAIELALKKNQPIIMKKLLNHSFY